MEASGPESIPEIHQLTKVLPEATFLLSEGGEVLDANPPAGRILGLSPQDLNGKHLRDLTTDPSEKVKRYLRVCLRSGAPVPGSLSFRTNDGYAIDCRCDGAALRPGDGEAEAVIFLRFVPKRSTGNTFLALNSELQALRNEHRRTRQERERLFGILESIDDAFFVVDRHWRFTYVNHRAEERWGHSREELLGKSIWEVFPQAAGSKPYQQIRRTMEERVATEFEDISPALDAWIAGRAYPSGDGVSVYFQDITERKQAEQAMTEVREAERSRMARDLHDGVLQDLAYAVQTMEFTKFQVQGTALEEELQEELDAIRNATRGLRTAVHDLRLADEQHQPFPRLLESLVERSREMASGQQIELDVKEGFPSIPLGETGTEPLRIIQEALTNARRHSGARNVLVTLRVEGEELAVEVSDDGRGFGSDTGPGVGLSSMRERATLLGGELEIRSEPGEGTTVRLRIPMPGRR